MNTGSRRKPARHGERGAALPLVLVLTLSMVILVGDLGLRTSVCLDRSRRSVKIEETRGLLKKIEHKLAALSQAEIESLGEQPVEFDMDEYQIQLTMKTTDDRINVARLDDLILGSSIQPLFEALLKQEHLEARAMPCALDWIDADKEARRGGAEGLDYSGERVTPRNAPFETLDELTFVRGFGDHSAFERIQPFLTTFGSGKICIPNTSDQMLDLFEDVYGVVVRNRLEDIRRNPNRSLDLPPNTLSAAALHSLQNIITTRPTAWNVTVTVSDARFQSRARYILQAGGGAADKNNIFRIG